MIVAALADAARVGAQSDSLTWVDEGFVELAMCFAGWTTLCMGGPGHGLGYVLSRLEVAGDPIMAYGYNPARLSPRSVPPNRHISVADMILQWPQVGIPRDRWVLRKIVLLRALWNDDRLRYVVSYPSIARKIGCSRAAARNWHRSALQAIAKGIVREPKRINDFLVAATAV